MGVDLAAYRTWIGCHGSVVHSTGCDVTGWISFCSFIWILLLIAGIEPNPGPKSKKKADPPEVTEEQQSMELDASSVKGKEKTASKSSRWKWPSLRKPSFRNSESSRNFVSKKSKSTGNFTQENTAHESGLVCEGISGIPDQIQSLANLKDEVEKTYMEALRNEGNFNKSVHTEEMNPDMDDKFKSFHASLNPEIPPEDRANFPKDDTLLRYFENLMQHMETHLVEGFQPGKLVKIGSCVDESKLKRVDEIDLLYELSEQVTIEHIEKNQYRVTNKNGEEVDPGIREKFADKVEEYIQLWAKFDEEDPRIEHSGFDYPRFSGVRYSGPAATLLLKYKAEKEYVEVSVDFTLAFKLPQELDTYKIRESIDKKMHTICAEYKTKNIPFDGIHLVPDVKNNAWLVTTAELESKLLQMLPEQSVAKVAFCSAKSICNEMSSTMPKHEQEIEVGKELAKLLRDCKRRQLNPVTQEWLKKILRHGYVLLSSKEASRYREMTKNDISVNSAAIKHIVLQKAMSDPKYLKEFDGHSAEVYDLIVEVFQVMKSTSTSIPHAFIPRCSLNKFSVSKLATLCGMGSNLHSVIRTKCQETWTKLQEHQKLVFEMEADELFEGTDNFRKYLINVDAIPDSHPAEYMYEVMVDPSVSPKRSIQVRQVDILVNALQNTCGGMIAITHDKEIQIQDTTLIFWVAKFIEHIRSVGSYVNINKAVFNASTKGTLITSLDVCPTVQREEFKSVRVDLQDDGSIRKFVLPKPMPDNDAEHQQPTTVPAKSEDHSLDADQSTPPKTKVAHTMKAKLKSGCSISFKKHQNLDTKLDLSEDELLEKHSLQCAHPTNFLPERNALLEFYRECPMFEGVLVKIERCSIEKSFAIEMKNSPCFGGINGPHDGLHLTDILVVDKSSRLFFHSTFTDVSEKTIQRDQNFCKARVLKKTIVKLVKQHGAPQSSEDLSVTVYPICHWKNESTISTIRNHMGRCIALHDLQHALLRILYEGNTKAGRIVKENLNIYLTGRQIETITLSETTQFYVIEGPPGSGKTTMAEHLCQKKGDCAILCPNKGVMARINHNKKAKAYWIDQLQDLHNLLQDRLAKLKFVIVDDAQYLKYDESTWTKILDLLQSSGRHMYLIIDSKYQAYLGDTNANNLKGLVVGKYDGSVPSALTEIHRNSRVVAEYIKLVAADLQVPKQMAFKCCNTLEGDDVKVTHVAGITDMSADNGLIKFIKKILSMNAEYKKEDLAILVLSEDLARNLIDIFQQHWPDISVQRAEKYPPEGIIIDTLEHFHGLDAPFVVSVLDGHDISNTKLKMAIASRGIKRVEFVREEVFDCETVYKLHFNPSSISPTDLARFDASTKTKDAENITVMGKIKSRSSDSDNSKRTPLMTACNSGHVDVVKSLLQRGVDINSHDRATALYQACQEGHIEVAKLLVKQGADIELGGLKPLGGAAIAGHIDIIHWLISIGANVNASNMNGCTALFCASQKGHLSVVEELVNLGADVNAGGSKPLLAAALHGQVSILHYLLDHGAEVNTVDHDGHTAMLGAAHEGYFEIVETLVLYGADMNLGKVRPLHGAALKGHASIVNFLLEAGAEADPLDDDGDTPLCCAAQGGHLDIVRTLLDVGADIDRGRIPSLGRAALTGHKETVIYLLEHGADVNATNNIGDTALCCAAQNGHLEVVDILIEAGSSLVKGHMSPLTRAALQGHTNVVIWLVTKGADVDYLDADGDTALCCATIKGQLDVIEALLEAGADVNRGRVPALAAAALNGHIVLVELLLSRGSDVNAVNHNGETALCCAAQNGHIEIVRTLVGAGADLEKGSMPPLGRAALCGHVNIIQYLLEKGVNINAKDKNGAAPLHCAAQRGELAAVQQLILNGADINAEDNSGDSPLFEACKNAHLFVAKELILYGADLSQGGTQALIGAAASGNVETVKFLLSQGIDVNGMDKYGRTPLFAACCKTVKVGRGSNAKETREQIKRLRQAKGRYDIVGGNQFLEELLNEEDEEEANFGSATCSQMDVVRELIRQGANVNPAIHNPLTAAAFHGKAELVRLLLDENADVDGVDDQGHTSMFCACLKGHMDVVLELYRRGANINLGNPLNAAALNGHTEIVDWLLALGAVVNSTDKDGDTPLFDACKHGQLDMAKKLVELGADISDGGALVGAAAGGNLDIVKWLISLGADVNGMDKYGRTPLFATCCKTVTIGSDDSEEVRKLVQRVQMGSSLASQYTSGNARILEQLLNKSNADSNTFESACAELDIARELIRQGANVNPAIHNPLTAAAFHGKAELVKLLLDEHADINSVDEQGHTALFSACLRGHMDVVLELVRRGANVNLSKPINAAANSGHVEIVEYLLKHGAEM